MDTFLLVGIELVFAVIFGAVLFVVLKNRRGKARKIDDFCSDRGFSVERSTKGLKSTTIVRGQNFLVESSSTQLGKKSDTLLETYEKTTKLSSGNLKNLPSFVLGKIPSDINWNSQDDTLKELALGLILKDTGLSYRASQARHLKAGASSFLLFEENPIDNLYLMENLKRILAAWPKNHQLLLVVKEEAIEILVSDGIIGEDGLLERIIEIWEGLVAGEDS